MTFLSQSARTQKYIHYIHQHNSEQVVRCPRRLPLVWNAVRIPRYTIRLDVPHKREPAYPIKCERPLVLAFLASSAFAGRAQNDLLVIHLVRINNVRPRSQ